MSAFLKGTCVCNEKLSWVAFLVLVVASNAQAAPFPCHDDIKTFCADVKPGGGRILACMYSHHDKLSQDCKDAAKARRDRFEEAKRACEGDVQSFCGDVRPGGGRVALCLFAHRKKLSASCKKASKERQKRRMRARQDCQDDVKQLCPGIRPGGGRLLACLADHAAELSPRCSMWFDEQ